MDQMDQGDDVLRERDVVGWARFLAEQEDVKFPEELAHEKYRPYLSAAIDNRRLGAAEWLPWIKARYARQQATRHIEYDDRPAGLDDDRPKRRVKKSKPAKVVKQRRRDELDRPIRIPAIMLPDQTLDEALQYNCECHRQLWNELLGLNIARYKSSKHFVSLKEMASAITAMRQDPSKFRFAADLPSDACWDVAAELNKALSSKPMPRFRKQGSRGYLRDIKVGVGELKLPRLERIKFRKRKIPQGRILGAYIEQHGSGWRAMLRIKSRVAKEGQIEAQIDESLSEAEGIRNP